MNPVEQRTIALARAQTVRSSQSRLKALLKTGEISLVDALEDPVARDMVWWRLVRALHGWGHGRVMQLAITLAQQGVPVDPQRRVRMLTVRQRLALIDAIAKPKQAKPSREQVVRVLPVLTITDPTCCQYCKTRLLVPNGLCGFCKVELEEAA